jgi:endonuclease YncB( thermonuclease family)
MAIIIITTVVCYVAVGRDDKLLIKHGSIPASLRTESSANLVGYIGRVWGGDNFEFGDANELHYFFITGIDCPEPGQPFFRRSKQFLLENFGHRILELTVDDYDDSKREFGHATYVNPEGRSIDVGLALVENGMAWYNGSQFEGADAYRDAFEKAKTEKRGLWAQPNPLPPWEFYQRYRIPLQGE